MHSNPVLKAQSIEVELGNKTILSPLSFDLRAGEILGIMGPNGAGKSTLIGALTREIPPRGGDVIFRNKLMQSWSLEERAVYLAALPQFTYLQFDFTPEEVIRMGRTPYPRNPVLDQKVIARCIEVCDLTGCLSRPYTQLSGGEKQRCQIARVLAQLEDASSGLESKLLLLDEPFSSLDVGHQQTLIKHFRRLSERGLAIILTLHDINALAQAADRLLVLDKGVCLGIGRPNEIITPALLKNTFKVNAQITANPTTGAPWINLL